MNLKVRTKNHVEKYWMKIAFNDFAETDSFV